MAKVSSENTIAVKDLRLAGAKNPTDEDGTEPVEKTTTTDCTRYHYDDPLSPFYAHPTVPTGNAFSIENSKMMFLKRKQKVGV